ncbi:hypothetical protein [Streptomyces sp. NPDC051211]|uniref:hypothetical protein n=1 Tax=Streptomyces sp. NPDC051211 TaxID=3154643 RepID=UPI00344BA1F5
MKLTKRMTAACTAVAAAALVFGAGGAHADTEGSLLSLLGTPSITLACFPSGQVGQGNTFTGTQNVNCSQSATSTSTGTTPSSGVPGYEVITERHNCGPNTTGECFVILECPPGKKATGGGITYDNISTPPPSTRANGPFPQGTDDPVRWVLSVNNPSPDGSIDWWASVICVNVDS